MIFHIFPLKPPFFFDFPENLDDPMILCQNWRESCNIYLPILKYSAGKRRRPMEHASLRHACEKLATRGQSSGSENGTKMLGSGVHFSIFSLWLFCLFHYCWVTLVFVVCWRFPDVTRNLCRLRIPSIRPKEHGRASPHSTWGWKTIWKPSGNDH